MDATTDLRERRLVAAEELLQEAVYRSRASQAAQVALAPTGSGDGRGQCGLGQQAAVVLDLSPRGADLFEELFGDEVADEEVARLRDVLSDWVVRQDQLDRDRNHFLKAFRHAHGFDRAAYTPDQLRTFEAGLAEVNDRCNRERREHAARLLGA